MTHVVDNPAEHPGNELIRVLQVDDDPTFLEISKQCLEREGRFLVDCAISVQEATERMGSSHYDVIVSDYSMPEKSGLEFLKQLRGQGILIPFILFTGKSSEDIAISSLNLGATKFLKKHGHPETVFSDLSAYILEAVDHALWEARQCEKDEKERVSKVKREDECTPVHRGTGPDHERQFAVLAELLPDGVVTLDLTGRVTSCNSANVAMTGYARDEVVGKHFSDLEFLRKEDSPDYEELFRSNLEGKTHDPFEVIWNHRDGTSYLAEVRAGLLKEGERISGVLVIARDITQRKEAERRLQESENKFRSIVEQSTHGIVLLDQQGAIVEWNKGQESITGLKREEVINKPVWDVYLALKFEEERTPASYQKIKTRMLEFLHNPSDSWVETLREQEIQQPGGEKKVVQVHVFPIHTDQGIMTGSIFQDITEKKEARRTLQSERDKLKALMDGLDRTGIGIDIVSIDHKVLLQNAVLKEEFGNLTGKLCYKEYIGMDEPCTDCPMIRAIRSSAVESSQFVNIHGKHIELISAPLPNSDGIVDKAIEVAIDNTERVRAERILNQTMKNLETMNEKLRVVGSLTRHDVRNKISTIEGSIYLMRKFPSLSEDALSHLLKIEVTCQQIERIFDFAKTYEQIGIEELTYICVEESLQEALGLCADLGGIEVNSQCSELRVLADSLLSSVLYDLIENSLKHGKTVKKINLYYHIKDDSLNLIYEDDGVGIPHSEKKKIFAEGYGKDTGYGLYIIHKICETYHWTVEERGEPGKGTRFLMNVPLTRNGRHGFLLQASNEENGGRHRLEPE
ncbi:MAG: PAS domain S-box protein [Theionarchaea archaeon]|nr:PAS domain S-box protein [Theionarchaea archaeon]MBU7038470.1 PAS domain S-box protein [Theionarchaea archaeon]